MIREEGNSWSLGDDEASFPTQQIEEWMFYSSASNPDGDSAVIMGRVEPQLAARIEDALLIARSKGIPLNNKSDFVRFGVLLGLESLVKHLQIEDEGIKHYLVLQHEAMRHAQNTSRFKEVKTAVDQLVAGVQVSTSNVHQEWEASRNRVVVFLNPLMSMSGDQDLLLRLYLRQLFTNTLFLKILSKIEEHVDLGNVINNARLAFERMNGEK